jgi:hypothetical protein
MNVSILNEWKIVPARGMYDLICACMYIYMNGKEYKEGDSDL